MGILTVGKNSSQSCSYIATAIASCLVLDKHAVALAFSRAALNTGNRIAARIATMAMTTKSSISVKPERFILIASFEPNLFEG
jgi:hypothetical protein